MQTPLTIILTLKGRPYHTLRYLWHANRTGFPHHILIADGEVRDSLASLLENPDTFPSLSYTYRRYPDDQTLNDFLAKLADVTARVRTPFAMLTDNDDFLFPSALQRSIAFLQKHAGYLSHSCGVAGFRLQSSATDITANLRGPITQLAYRYGQMYAPYDISAGNVLGRLKAGYAAYSSVWYNVYRSDMLKQIVENLRRMEFKTFEPVIEDFCAIQALLAGRHRSEADSISYIRQMDSSLRLVSPDPPPEEADLMQDFSKLLGATQQLIQLSGDKNIKACIDTIGKTYQHRLNFHLQKHFMRYAKFVAGKPPNMAEE
ncbi:MAG: TIGR00180 family glycosyltransferase, partial [Rhodobacteraceae bacterium]|nr:TIGR00180 family glycosyltransferase [Paracoccaceae bacterium]